MGLYVNRCQTSKNFNYDSERDMADIGDEYFALESLANKQNVFH